MKTRLMREGRRARLALQEFAPYAALLLLPGGSVLAVAAWFYRHRSVLPGRST
jgi:hypothetical protein